MRMDKVYVFSGARDIGDAKGDKARKVRLADLVKRATTLLEDLTPGSFPEVEDAAKTVQEMMDLSISLDDTATKLKDAPAAGSESVAAQKDLDRLRLNLDAMLHPLEVTMASMETLLAASLEMEAQFSSLTSELKTIEESLKREKTRLASTAQAVKNASQASR